MNRYIVWCNDFGEDGPEDGGEFISNCPEGAAKLALIDVETGDLVDERAYQFFVKEYDKEEVFTVDAWAQYNVSHHARLVDNKARP